jgi:hypothetical protein
MPKPTAPAATRRFTRHEASQYLKDSWGIVRSAKTLSNMASSGLLRPLYDGNRPLYTQAMLDDFGRHIVEGLTERPANGRRAAHQVQQAA